MRDMQEHGERARAAHAPPLMAQASALRLLERSDAELGQAQVLASLSHTIGVSRRTRVPLGGRDPTTTELFVPRYSKVRVSMSMCQSVSVPVPATAAGYEYRAHAMMVFLLARRPQWLAIVAEQVVKQHEIRRLLLL
jgi:hypothetical protein